MLHRDAIFKETDEKMNVAEKRVKELEDSLENFIVDFEKQNNDLSVCA